MPGGILLTGFDPFDRFPVNSSWEGIRTLQGVLVRGRRVEVRRLPVSFTRSRIELLRCVRALRPALVIAFGLADEGRIRLEKVALNVAHSERPDNEGRRRHDRPVAVGRPLALLSRLPLAAIERRLSRGGFRARLSFHAGTYLCNLVFHTLLAETRLPAGFVHVPPLATARRRRGRIARRTLERAVRVIVDEAARTVAPTRRGSGNAPSHAR